MVFPYTSIDLRNPGIMSDVDQEKYGLDTVIFDILRYKVDDLSQYSPGPEQYSADYLAYLNKIFTASEKIKDDIGSFVETVTDMVKLQMNPLGIVSGNPHFYGAEAHYRTRERVYAKLTKLLIEFNMNNQQKQHQQALARAAHFPNTFLRLQARANHEMLIERTQTLENTEFEDNHKLKSGFIKITVKHDPQ
jgi:hypothetical protein